MTFTFRRLGCRIFNILLIRRFLDSTTPRGKISAVDPIFILLTPEWLDSFVSWAPIGSAVYVALMAAVDINRIMKNSPYRFMVKCNEKVAKEMQRIAAEHCPAALDEIAEALRACRK